MTLNIESLRASIDKIDADLLHLLNERSKISIAVGKTKSSAAHIFNPAREAEVLAQLAIKNKGPLPNPHLQAIWREIFSSSRSLQHKQRVAFLGPEGTFSYFAGLEYLGASVDYAPCFDLRAVFQSVYNNQCDLGIVPLENSLQGTIGQSIDLFAEIDVLILAEFFFKVTHNLFSAESDLSKITKIYSHPQPLGQCERWLRSNMPGVPLISVESTAQAAILAAAEAGAAAIGHINLALRHSMHILAEGIEDNVGNYTRFMVIAPKNAAGGANVGIKNKTSLIFTVVDKPGSLVSVLEIFVRAGVNMSKLESRPQPGQNWKYIFFADIDCELDTEPFKHIIRAMDDVCGSVRILGSYAKAVAC